ncbi:MAG: anhydro-N-acetylmuramic acid kinase [Aggregatilineales bacterium]
MIVAGLMSGTSADGVDVALCELTGAPPTVHAKTLHATMYPYESSFQKRIHDNCIPEVSRVDDLCKLGVAIGERFADALLETIKIAGLSLHDVDLIGSHGQTFWHQVEPDGQVSATLQLGEAAVIAERTGITTISNFRARDVAVGGQGAPLTSYADWLLLRHPTHWRAIQNIGGMGNVTFLPPITDTSSLPIAFDTGPGNALMDTLITRVTGGTETYDKDGLRASRGKLDEDWLTDLLDHPYYRREPPKTTGRELFGAEMTETLITYVQEKGLSLDDALATLTMLTAQTITDAYANFSPSKIGEVILGGGGRRNPTLVKMMQTLLGGATILTHEDIGMDSDNKEALVFAVLAYETWHNRAGNLPSLTGASKPVVMGQITPGENYAMLIQKTWGA